MALLQGANRMREPFQSFQGQRSVGHRLRERAPALLSLFQSVEDKLAGVNESLHTVDEAHFRPRVQLWPRFVHTFILQTDKSHWKSVAKCNGSNY